MTKELLIRYSNGDAVTDEECYQLRDFYKKLCDDLALLEKEYNLAWYPLKLELQRVESYIEFRKSDSKRVVKNKEKILLHESDPKCDHEITSNHSGIRCRKCGGWFCY